MRPFRITAVRRHAIRRSLAEWRAGETDTKTVVIIVVAVVGGMSLLVCGLLVALLLPALQQAREAARRTQSKNNLKQIGLALHNYHDVHATFPPGGIYGEDGTAYHSWQSTLLPYVDSAPLYNRIDYDYPWTDPVNADLYRTVVPVYLHPSDESAQFAPDGFAASHYAGSSQVFFPNSNIRIRDILDGTANTLMAGEVGAGYKAWGDPTNVRDPADGIRVSPDTFGRDDAQLGANMLLMDGSVRYLSGDIAPDVLKALSTYDGGEQVGEF